jgi:hypothetical protein
LLEEERQGAAEGPDASEESAGIGPAPEEAKAQDASKSQNASRTPDKGKA